MVALLTTKTFWIGIALIGFGIYQMLTGDTDSGGRTIMEGLGLLTLRDAIRKMP
jgi:hypothetical protein